MDMFQFSPELFQTRTEVMVALDSAGYQWLSHYGSVDCQHDLFGFEVCGIGQEQDAYAMHEVLRPMFPNWYSDVWYKDYGYEPGWVVEISKDRPHRSESWKTA